MCEWTNEEEWRSGTKKHILLRMFWHFEFIIQQKSKFCWLSTRTHTMWNWENEPVLQANGYAVPSTTHCVTFFWSWCCCCWFPRKRRKVTLELYLFEMRCETATVAVHTIIITILRATQTVHDDKIYNTKIEKSNYFRYNLTWVLCLLFT